MTDEGFGLFILSYPLVLRKPVPLPQHGRLIKNPFTGREKMWYHIVDLILKDKIVSTLKPNEKYEGINWGRKIKILEENYDVQIANNIQEIFRIGGDGSHFNGIVKDDNLQIIINKVIYIVEDIFVKYFLEPEHEFGSENIFTIPFCRASRGVIPGQSGP